MLDKEAYFYVQVTATMPCLAKNPTDKRTG